MGLDMTFGEAYIRLNWAGVGEFRQWSQDKLGYSFFDLLTPGWDGGNGQELRVKPQDKKAFLTQYDELLTESQANHAGGPEDLPCRLKQIDEYVNEHGCVDSLDTDLQTFYAQGQGEEWDADGYFSNILAICARQLRIYHNKWVPVCMG